MRQSAKYATIAYSHFSDMPNYCYYYYSKTSSTRTRITQTLRLRGRIFFGPAKSPWFYTEMSADNTDWVSMDFLITQTVFLARRVLVNTDGVARTGDMARGRQVVYGYITYSVLAT